MEGRNLLKEDYDSQLNYEIKEKGKSHLDLLVDMHSAKISKQNIRLTENNILIW